jgi:hypothetical protein
LKQEKRFAAGRDQYRMPARPRAVQHRARGGGDPLLQDIDAVGENNRRSGWRGGVDGALNGGALISSEPGLAPNSVTLRPRV